MNLGKIRNRGIELLIKRHSIRTKDFSWELTWNFTKNWSKVISLPEELGGITTIYGLNGGTTSMYAITGMPVGVFKGSGMPNVIPRTYCEVKFINRSSG